MANGNGASPLDFTQWDTQVFTARHALAKREPTKYVIDRVLPEASLSVIYGAAGSYKTLIAIDLMTCALLGLNWLVGPNQPGYKCAKSPCFWMDVDNGSSIMHERFGASLRGHCLSEKQAGAVDLHYMSFPMPAFMANNPASLNEAIRRIKEWNVKLVGFDNLGMISGGVDENSSQMIQVMQGLRFIAEKTGAAVVVVHHDPKNGGGSRLTPRGHSSIEAAVDLALYISREGDSFTASPTKQRRAPVNPFSALLEFDNEPNSTDLRKYKFVGIEEQVDKSLLKAYKLAVKCVKMNNEATQSQLVAALKPVMGRNIALGVLNDMTKRGILKLKPNPGNKVIYALGASGEAYAKDIDTISDEATPHRQKFIKSLSVVPLDEEGFPVPL